MKKIILILIISMFSISLHSKVKDETIVTTDTEIIDMPTSGIIDYTGFNFKNRFYNGGGVLTYMNFGVMERLNLGASFMVDNLIGAKSPVRMVRPEIQVKFRFYDGGIYLPSLALGYDGQGYYYDRDLKKYMEKGKGLYIVGSREVLLPGLFANGGFNIPDFDDNYLFMFLGVIYNIEDKFALLAEYDNLFHKDDPERFNIGARIYITPSFNVDLAIREVGKNEKFKNNWQRKAERIIQLRYSTNF